MSGSRDVDAATGVAGKGQLRLRELTAIAIGGMVGGGIFSMLGLAVSVSGNGAPVAFLVGGVIASFAGYSYVKLALTFRDDGASFTYLEVAFPHMPFVGALVGWLVVIGYVGTLALYAYTFGAYGADLLGDGGSTLLRSGLSISILLAFMGLNLTGAKSTGVVEDVIVFVKVALLAGVAAVAVRSFDGSKMTPVFDEGVGSVFVAGALVFVAFEGFQLVTNAVVESTDPERNIPRAIYGSIATVTVIYVALSVTALGTLGAAGLIESKEYALAAAAKPTLGTAGGVIVGIAALFATSSAINGTAFGASRMMAKMATDRIMPSAFSFRNRSDVPWVAIVVMTAAGIAFTAFGSLEVVAAFSSITFLLVVAAVGVANIKLKERTGSNLAIVVAGLILTLSVLVLLVGRTIIQDPGTLVGIFGAYAAVAAFEFLFTRRGTFPLWKKN